MNTSTRATKDITKEGKLSFLGDTLVLDMADGQGGFCSKLLADLGARVVKVAATHDNPAVNPESLYCNTNKLCVTVDANGPEGLATLRGLIGEADVLIEDTEPGRTNVLGLGRERVYEINPALIHLSLTGFGKAGPKGTFRWCDAVLSAYGGQAGVVGPSSGPPRSLAGRQTDYSSSLFGAVAILLALREKKLTGKGRHIDLSGQEAIASTLDHVMTDYFQDGTICRRQGDVYGDGSFAIFACSDGHVLLSLWANWETLVELIAAEGKAEDLVEEKWQESAYRTAHLDHIKTIVGRWTKAHTKAELFTLGQAMRFPWAPVCTPEEVLESPQLASRQFFVSMPMGPDGKGVVLLPGSPYKFRFFSPVSPQAVPESGKRDRRNRDGLGWPWPRGEGNRSRRREGEPCENKGPVLDGIRVLDFTRMLAGPYATRILADFGAEVIKVEHVKPAEGGERNDDAYDAAWNRNKRSVTLDLEQPEARRIVSKLAAAADVVVENFSPRVMANWSLTYDDLKKARPDIIMASLSAMGQTGPWKDYVGFGPTFHALSGLVSETSRGLDTPVCPGHAYGDTVIGLYAAIAILAALRRRDVTGQGEYIDLSGYEALCTLFGPVLLGASGSVEAWPKEEDADYVGCYPCMGEDRWCVVAVSGERDWEALRAVVGLPRLEDDMFSSAEERNAHRNELDAIIASWTAERAPEQVVGLLQRAGVAAGVVQHAQELAHDQQLLFRHFFVSLIHPTLGTLRSDRSALLLPGIGRREWKAAPLPGEDNDYVFGRLLGFSGEELRRYKKEGIIAWPHESSTVIKRNEKR